MSYYCYDTHDHIKKSKRFNFQHSLCAMRGPGMATTFFLRNPTTEMKIAAHECNNKNWNEKLAEKWIAQKLVPNVFQLLNLVTMQYGKKV